MRVHCEMSKHFWKEALGHPLHPMEASPPQTCTFLKALIVGKTAWLSDKSVESVGEIELSPRSLASCVILGQLHNLAKLPFPL